MNPDFAIILNFKLKSTKDVDADFLVKTARDIGARAVATNQLQDEFKLACAKYTVALVDGRDGIDATSDDVIDKLVANRKIGQSSFINVEVAEKNAISSATKEVLTTVNNWMHIFGHAFNDSQPCNLTADSGFVLQNRHLPYQKYVFVNKPLPKQVIVSGLTVAPNRVEMIENRCEPAFTFQDNALTIDLTEITSSNLPWQIIRIQEHRPEDDIKETKF